MTCEHTTDKLTFTLKKPVPSKVTDVIPKDLIKALDGKDQYLKYGCVCGYNSGNFLNDDIPILE